MPGKHNRNFLFKAVLAASATLAVSLTAVSVVQSQVGPGQSNIILDGTELASLNVATPADCLSECKRVSGCTGFNFAGTIGGRVFVPPPNGSRRFPDRPLPAPNCRLMTGGLTSRAVNGVQSCAMPCDGGQPSGGGFVPGGTRIPLEPGAGTAKGRIPREVNGGVAVPPEQPGAVILPPRTTIFNGGVYSPPPGPQPAAPTPLTGFEIVRSGIISVGPLSSATASASCSQGKVAISVGYIAAPQNPGAKDAGRGLEIKSAIPNGGSGDVTLRNANVFERATLQAIATCIDPVAGMRSADMSNGVQGPETLLQACGTDEVVIGGGFEGAIDGHLRGSFPHAGGWQVDATKATPLPGRWMFTSRAICAPAKSVAGWQAVGSSRIALGAQSNGTQSIGCTSGLTAIAGGIDGAGGSNDLAMISNTLEPNGSGWSAFVWNRDTVAGPASVAFRAAAICAQVK